MKISYSWLKELVSLKWSVEKTIEKLAELGFPVEFVSHVGVQVKNVVSVKILSVSKHPNADRLQIAQVTDGKSERTIVCGAPNIAVGQVVPCALPGAKLPGGVEIVVSKIRGQESQGMLCSARELMLSEDHGGIYQLPANSPLGKEVSNLLGGTDTVLDLEVTPNRPDLLSHIGVARELAAAAGKFLPTFHSGEVRRGIKSPPSLPTVKRGEEKCPVKIEEPKLCSRYTAKLFHGIKVGPSPEWMVKRLKACGIRSINNIVDITNYVLLEWGHPLHAFDLAKLEGPQIIVRRARAGEKFLALDEKEYKLETSDLVIADAKRPVAIAGIMGGQDSGVTNQTTDILLESAVFDRVSVRQTSRRLMLRSESSIRFEKGTDAITAEEASIRAAALVIELAGGTAGRAEDAYPVKEKARNITLRHKRFVDLLGVGIPKPSVAVALKNLSLKPAASGQGWKCVVPSYRKDLLEEVDVIEEVVRMIGYHAIPSAPPQAEIGKMSVEYRKWDDGVLIDTLKGLGISETMTSSFCAVESSQQMGIQESELTPLSNPLSKEETVFRPSLLPNLLRAALRNFNHQQDAVALFEIGNVCRKGREEKKLGIIVGGTMQPQTWLTKPKPADIFYVKGVLESLGQTMKLPMQFSASSDQSFLHPRQAFNVIVQGKMVGWAGLLHPSLTSQLGLSAPCGVMELSHAALCKDPTLKAKALPKYPFVERDIAVLLDKEKIWDELKREAERAAGPLLVNIWPFDVFTGGTLQSAQKSVAFRVRLQHPDHTLLEAEISQTVDAIKNALQKNCGAQLR